MNELIANGWVDLFWRVENQFLEVLLTRFDLERTEAGTFLKVAFHEQTPAVWLRDGRRQVGEWMKTNPGYEADLMRYQKEIDRFIDSGAGEKYAFDNPAFPFRYVSGGTLPIVRMGGVEYYALFYRDVFPIGWNLSNGGSDTREELLQPTETIERELREELMVVAPRHKARYVFPSESGNTVERSEYAAARRLWEDRFVAGDYKDFDAWNELPIPLKWLPGPDSLQVTMEGVKPQETTDCFVTITAEDFGIEIDRVAKITIDEDAVLLDGDVHGSRLLNRPVGLFEVDRLNAEVSPDQTCYLPDRYFHGVPSSQRMPSYYQGGEWLDHGAPAVLNDIKEWRSGKQIREFVDCQRKFDLCPVTKRMIQRVARLRHGEDRPHGSPGPGTETGPRFFVSYGGNDERFARKVYDFIRERLGMEAYFNAEGKRHSHFRREIENALEQSDYFISVGSSTVNLRREWPTYESQVFHNDMLNHNKPGRARILSLITGIDPRHLPLPQRLFEAIEFDPLDMDPALAKLTRYFQVKAWRSAEKA